MDVYRNNPIFGLNAPGGALNFTGKNGCTYQAGAAQIYGGSYARPSVKTAMTSATDGVPELISRRVFC